MANVIARHHTRSPLVTFNMPSFPEKDGKGKVTVADINNGIIMRRKMATSDNDSQHRDSS